MGLLKNNEEKTLGNIHFFNVSGIALATYFLRLQIIILMRGKRSLVSSAWSASTVSHPSLTNHERIRTILDDLDEFSEKYENISEI